MQIGMCLEEIGLREILVTGHKVSHKVYKRPLYIDLRVLQNLSTNIHQMMQIQA
jgi:hypothetical protein